LRASTWLRANREVWKTSTTSNRFSAASAIRRWKSLRPSVLRQPEWKSQYSSTIVRSFSAANFVIAWRCASGEKPCPCSSVDSRTYIVARPAGAATSATNAPFACGGELVAATEPPVREPAGEVELLRCGIERAQQLDFARWFADWWLRRGHQLAAASEWRIRG